MGNAGPLTANCGRLDTALCSVRFWRLLFVTMSVSVSVVPTATEPKLSAFGEAPTPARVTVGKKAEPQTINPQKRHTRRVLFTANFLRRFLRSAVGAERGGRLRAARVLIQLTRCGDYLLLVMRTDSGQVCVIHARAIVTCPAFGKELDL